ncbi:MAG: InlB B-repeat-containing protein [Clostridia bacterium]|nr:InlB B-repeat-containing protein [Clostridia bacterium]
MKKKLLSFILAICLIIPCAFIFSACNNNMHTVTFIYNNGTENSTIQVEEGKFAPKPTDPVKVGYTFDGWYYSGEKWSFFLIPVTQNVELTANWKINTFTVTFKYDNGLEDREMTYNYGSLLTEPQQPEKENYVFLGWFNGETKWDFENDTITSNLELVAHWQRSRLAVTFDPNNGESRKIKEVAYGTKLGDSPFPSLKKEGYTFDGWYNGDTKWDLNHDVVTDTLLLVAKWVPVE